ncbi:hypothetical protein [Bacillus sp. REN16]|uniref:hypothetical protein n=1 Tax=Bacillus sp. REN16 TaxID=2887296 RepID=UPI001E3AFC66|nr:hypothetical protein [Bacillus sp. REN16]MCC3356755.1 hypothetical protein [Bacillus sp. REN16]
MLKGLKQRRKRFFAVLKIALVFYLMIFSIKYVTSSTSAHFTSSDKTNISLTAGSWVEPDNSRLKFTDNGNFNLKACPAKTEVTIKNVSDSDMKSPSKFEIYYIDKDYDKDGEKEQGGNPKIQGTKINIPEGEDVIPALASGEQTKLSFMTNLEIKEGFYKFYAYQTNKSVEDVWSVKVKVMCKDDNGKKQNNQSESTIEEPANNSVETEKIELPEANPTEETGSDKPSNQTPENKEQTSTNGSEEPPATTESNAGNQTPDAVNNTVPDVSTNDEGNKEKDGQ